MKPEIYLAIDLKSFYASVECADRKLDPLQTNLVVADPERTDKTICLAVSPPLKALGVPGRPRLFEVVRQVRDINRLREQQAPGRKFTGSSILAPELEAHPELQVDYLTAKPRMSRYLEVSAAIFSIYLRYVAPEDIHAYSIDEVFISIGGYLRLYRLSPRELAGKMIREVLRETGITATAGIGTNLYLAKIAMDIEAKHLPADRDGVRIAELNEQSYREKLWGHRPLTDFWRIGPGYARKLEAHGMRTMGEIARMSLRDEEVLYRLFGVNAELLIDHAWGLEPATIADIKAYKPADNSLSSGQVLQEPADAQRTALIILEMADALALDLTDKGLTCSQLTLTIGYDVENLTDPERRAAYHGEIHLDHYGRQVPKAAHGSARLPRRTASAGMIAAAVRSLTERILNPGLLTRRLVLAAGHLLPAAESGAELTEQPELFTLEGTAETAAEREKQEKEARLQQAIVKIRKRHGKNALLKGMNLLEGATARERNRQIGGHRE